MTIYRNSKDGYLYNIYKGGYKYTGSLYVAEPYIKGLGTIQKVRKISENEFKNFIIVSKR